jgi:hypothetical protein
MVEPSYKIIHDLLAAPHLGVEVDEEYGTPSAGLLV